ncbi:MAG: iron-containing alcohol dehydrogenase [Candidatus Lokiarchaeota archaeon]|nr:iron-containing alcohol dehydrogenase [Candidatus Lokiarchaeota archaeon]
MENLPDNVPLYELDMVKDMISAILGRAPAQIMMGRFKTAQIYYGLNALNQISGFLEPRLNKEERRVLIITDDFTEKFAGRVIEVLNTIDAVSKVWAGVKPEGPLDTIEVAVEVCKGFKPTVFIAIGGGSVMDSAKAIMIKYEKPEANFYQIIGLEGLGLRKKVKYLIACPTTSGTGSEVTSAAMLTDLSRDPPKKLAVSHSEIVPDIAILHTDFVKDMPPFLTMATGLDTLAHSAGAYVSSWGGPLNDALNIAAIKEVLKYLPRAYKYGAKDLEAREKMQFATAIAGMGFSNSKVGLDHGLGHSFGKVFNRHHGFSVGLFLPYTVAYTAKISDRWKDLCPVFGIESNGKERKELLTALLQAIKDFIHSIDGAVCVKEIKNPTISKEDYFGKIDLLAKYAETDAVDLLAPRWMHTETYKKIFDYAWDGRDVDF